MDGYDDGFRRADGFINYDAIVADNRSTADPYTGGFLEEIMMDYLLVQMVLGMMVSLEAIV